MNTAVDTAARDAALRALRRPGGGWWALVTVLGATVGFGLYAWVVQLRHGMGAAGYNDHAFWAVYIADVVTFIGVSYGGAVVSAILRLTGAGWRAPLTRLAEGTAVCTVLVGAALIVAHIGYPSRLYELVTQPNLTAPVFWDFIAVSTYTTASLVFFALPLVPDMAIMRAHGADRLGRLRGRLYQRISRGWTGAPRQRRVLAGALGLVSIMIIPLAVSVHSVLAWAFSTTSRPWWHESIWAPQFVVAALYSGVALVILVVAGFRRGYHLEAFITPRHFVRLGFILATLGAAYLYLTFADVLPGAYVGENSTSAIFGELIVGRMAGWFWLFIVAGGIVPLALVAMPWTRTVGGMVVAASLIVPMMWLKRLLMVITPANFDVVTGASGTYHFTWVAVAITLAALAAVPLLLMLMFRVVPLLSLDEIEEYAAEQHSGHGHGQPATPAPPHPVPRELAPAGGAARTGAVALVLLALALAAAVLWSPARASAAPAGGTPTVVLSGAEVDGTVRLTARVTGPGGAPVTAGEVQFLVTSTVFGPRQVPIGSVPLDAAGTATLVLGGHDWRGYRPTATGPQEFTASFAAQVGDTPVTYSTNVTITVAHSGYTPAAPKPLEGAGGVLIKVLFGLVGTVWLLLIAQVARVWWVCRPDPVAATARQRQPGTPPRRLGAGADPALGPAPSGS